MLELYSDFSGLSADATTPAAPADTAAVQSIADQIFGLFDSDKKRNFQLQMAQLSAQQQMALAQQAAASESKWTTPMTVGAIAVAGIVGLLLFRAMGKK
jgi:hypothetical protein